MSSRYAHFFLMVLLLATGTTASASTTVTIDTSAAKAVLQALQNPNLSRGEALTIAGMYGNDGVVRKLREFKIPATTTSFADALYDAAHGKLATTLNQRAFLFDMIRPKVPQLIVLVAQIEKNPVAFQAAVEKRIALFTPPDAVMQLYGYVVAAGDGGGYAFGTTDFYLNIGITDEFIVAKDITTHELYHAVQGQFAAERKPPQGADAAGWTQSCKSSASLFSSLYEEGSAVVVEDTSQLERSTSPIALRKREDLIDGMRHIDNSVTLLEMSVDSFEASPPVAHDDVYAVGFYGHAVLYNISYVMAKAIAEDEGAESLTSFLKRPPYEFVLHYAELKMYGTDSKHPRLGANTLAMAHALRNGCATKR
jgi:hypothetical protein